MRNKPILIFYFIMLPVLPLIAQVPFSVGQNLKKAGKNRVELEKAISHYKTDKDKLKLKALYYLIGEMSHHISANYNWIDASGKKVPFNELAYKNQDAANLALNKLKQTHQSLKAVPYVVNDLKTISSKDLIHNIDFAFYAWRQSAHKNISFANFCEYILPYRVSVEPFQQWRSIYYQKNKWITEGLKKSPLINMLRIVRDDHRSFFESTWGKEVRSEPLPRLGAQQLLFRRKGMCEDGVAFNMFTLRSQGIPCAQNVVPFWATAKGSHFFTTVFDPNMKPILYDAGKPVNNPLVREPGKVLRITYASQTATLANMVNQNEIPQGVLRSKNYIDVTDAHWPSVDIEGRTYDHIKTKLVYACVLNGLKWQPIWWAKVKNGTFVFTKMAKGAVYLPCVYKNGVLQPAGDPVAQGYNNRQQIIPNTTKMVPLIINEQKDYLRFKDYTYYTLYYWDKKWVPIEKQMPKQFATQMLFGAVPANSLYLLLPDNPIGAERPFMITPKGERIWF